MSSKLASRGARRVFVAASVASFASIASAQPRANGPRIDSRVRAELAIVHARAGSDALVDVVLELRDAHDATVREVTALSNRGVLVRFVDGAPLRWKRWLAARVSRRGVTAIAHCAAVARVRASTPAGMQALAQTVASIGLSGARGTAVRDGTYGHGVLVADLDSLVDVFHPALFHADAGWYDWVDANADGAFTPGVDTLAPRPDETLADDLHLHVLEAQQQDVFRGAPIPRDEPAFDPAVDWLYVDVNGDGARNHGPADGFDDTAPAFGEPLFVPDDANANGRLDPSERLVRLGTSKIREELVVTLTATGTRTRTYRRGEDLTSVPLEIRSEIFGLQSAQHGTGVAGIVVGDVPLVGRRNVGLAPEAEMVIGAEAGGDLGNERLMWALMRDPAVVLHEYVTWTRVPLDGSDVASELIDTSTREADVAHVCPAGNTGGGGKHARVPLAATETREVTLSGSVSPTLVELSLLAPSGSGVRYELVEPRGLGTHTLNTGTESLVSGGVLVTTSSTTTRGIDQVDVRLGTTGGRTLANGTWIVRMMAGPSATTVHAFVGDDRSGFGAGVQWQEDFVTDASTISWPATADACIALGAIPSHTTREGDVYRAGGGEVQDEVRAFSSRGPRIDGRKTLSLVAPDNPWTAWSEGPLHPGEAGSRRAPHGAYGVFGGTSGAGAVVAGVMALLAQQGARGASASEALTAHVTPLRPPAPVDDYGLGKLDAAAALGATRGGSPPTIVVTTEATAHGTWQATPMVADPDGATAVRVRWDDGYDGAWDTDWVEPSMRELAPGRYKLRARDDSGHLAEATLILGAPAIDGGIDAPPSHDGGGCACVTPRADAFGPRIGVFLLGICLLTRGARRRAARARRGARATE